LPGKASKYNNETIKGGEHAQLCNFKFGFFKNVKKYKDSK